MVRRELYGLGNQQALGLDRAAEARRRQLLIQDSLVRDVLINDQQAFVVAADDVAVVHLAKDPDAAAVKDGPPRLQRRTYEQVRAQPKGVVVPSLDRHGGGDLAERVTEGPLEKL